MNDIVVHFLGYKKTLLSHVTKFLYNTGQYCVLCIIGVFIIFLMTKDYEKKSHTSCDILSSDKSS